MEKRIDRACPPDVKNSLTRATQPIKARHVAEAVRPGGRQMVVEFMALGGAKRLMRHQETARQTT